ncbi:hypothetical protein CEXT_474051 [Caerostris extrusa]|uniref:Uncharacterized protein n=1 Tax=Caerostris extrusa TaxID=172846 RepID=A0AAV4WHC1_CAEEX|nr:hypothetical protein CEXT_474051 [Caerostris extrusa]
MQSLFYYADIMKSSGGSVTRLLLSLPATLGRSYEFNASRLITRVSGHGASVIHFNTSPPSSSSGRMISKKQKKKKRLQKKCLEWREEKEKKPNIVRSFPEGMFCYDKATDTCPVFAFDKHGCDPGCSVVATDRVDKRRRRNKIEMKMKI